MKLLDNSKTAIAVLDEGTTKLAYYAKDPAIVYFTGATATKAPNKCTITKVGALAGDYIETDSGSLIALTGTTENMIATLEKVLGTKIGYVDVTGSTEISSETVEFYKEADTNDKNTITITVHVSDGSDDLIYNFTRGTNAVTVKDLLKKIGTTVNGVAVDHIEDTEGNVLTKKNKLLEDQELNLILETPTVNNIVVNPNTVTDQA